MLIKRDIDEFQKVKQLNKYMIGHKGFIAGGCFKNIFKNEKIRDIDMFFENEKDFNEALNYFENDINTLGEKRYFVHYENPKVVAYKESETGIVVELIRHVYGTPEEILNSFDFTIVKFAYYKEIISTEIDGSDLFIAFDVPPSEETETKIEYKCLVNDMFFEHLLQNRLVIDDRIDLPYSTFERMLKYAKYGYFPCKDTKLYILQEIKDNENDVYVGNSLYNGLD